MEFVLAAALLGLAHAAEPDHVAGIAALGGDASARRAGLVGAAFGAGHALLVVAWVLAGAVVLGSLPAPGALAAVGDAVVGVALVAVGAATLARALGSGHDHAGVALPGLLAVPERPLGAGVAGALFTLSPPVSMLAFVTGLLTTVGGGAVAAAVATYTAAIVAGMTVVGALAGTAFDALADRGLARAGRALASAVVVALGVVVLV